MKHILLISILSFLLVGCLGEENSDQIESAVESISNGDNGDSNSDDSSSNSPKDKNKDAPKFAQPNGPVEDIEILEDGSVAIVGDFTRVGDNNAPGVAVTGPKGRLNEDFMEAIGDGPNGPVHGVIQDEDGGLILVGNFDQFNGEPSSSGVAVDASGGVDVNPFSGDSGANGPIHGIVKTDGGEKIYFGDFDSVGGDSAPRLVVAKDGLEPSDPLDEATESDEEFVAELVPKKKKNKNKKKKRDVANVGAPLRDLASIPACGGFVEDAKVLRKQLKGLKAEIKSLKALRKEKRTEFRRELASTDDKQTRKDMRSKWKEQSKEWKGQLKEKKSARKTLVRQFKDLRKELRKSDCMKMYKQKRKRG